MGQEVVTTTYTLDITLGTSSLEGDGTDTIWKLDNPKSGLALSDVTTAFEDIFSDCAICTANGTALVAVKKAKTVLTVKTVTDLT